MLESDLTEDILPPEIALIYEDNMYKGKLLEYSYKVNKPFSELQTPDALISFNNTESFINITKNSKIEFKLDEYPQVLIPSELSATVYSPTDDPIVLMPLNNQNTFKIDLNPGKYLLLVSTTWSQLSEYNVSGYVLHSFNINIQ